MQVFVGLGNPGNTYQNTRHNVGWMVLDRLAERFQAEPFHLQKNLQAEISKTRNKLFIKPQTFMNLSGLAVREALKFYANFSNKQNQSLPNIFVFHDDLDLELGSFKLQFGKGPKIHNGLLSLYQHLDTDQFWHVRIGIDSRRGDRSIPGKDYVLKPFTAEEKNVLREVESQIIAAVTARLDTI